MSASCNACGATLQRNQVKKEGPNKGKFFFSCPNNQNGPNCKKSFVWDDAPTHSGNAFAPLPTGAVSPAFLSEATALNLISELQLTRAALTGTAQPGAFEPMA
jgi:hypothetical protein